MLAGVVQHAQELYRLSVLFGEALRDAAPLIRRTDPT